jgi:hypothetical protein
MTRITTASAGLAGASILLALSVPPASAASEYGSTTASDGTLRKGCHNYGYRYRITTPTNDWTLETFLRDPTGEGIASGAFLSESDARTQPARFRLCRYATRPGRFTIRALLHWYDDGGEEHRVWLEPTRFRLTRPR